MAEKKGRPVERPFCQSPSSNDLSTIVVVVVIVIIPIVLVVPAASIFIPPAMGMFPAIGAGFPKLVAPILGLPAFPAVMLHGFMKLVVRVPDALLAIIIRADRPRSCKQKNSCKSEAHESAANRR